MEQAKTLNKTTENKVSQAESKETNQTKEKKKTAFYVAQGNFKVKCKDKEYRFFAGSIYKNLPDCEEIKKLIRNKTFKKL